MPNNTSSHTPGKVWACTQTDDVNGTHWLLSEYPSKAAREGRALAIIAMQGNIKEHAERAAIITSAPTLAAELERVKAQLAALTISLDTSIDTNGLLREELRREHSSVMALGPELASSMNEISRLKSLNSELVEALTALHRTIISLSEQSDTNALDRLEIIRRDNEPTIQKARAALAKSEKGI